MARRLGIWAGLVAGVAVIVFAVSGQWTDTWLWSYVGSWAALTLYGVLSIDNDLARERFSPPEPGADRVALRAVRLTGLAQLVVGALDVGRWHAAPVPTPLRLFGFAAMIVSTLMVFRAMSANRYFSAVVRVQSDRGHQVVDRGPYAHVRHPGYAGMITAIPFSALALGSWLAVGLALVYSALIVRRVLFEDAFLRRNLEGYAAYTHRVPYRLIPHVW